MKVMLLLLAGLSLSVTPLATVASEGHHDGHDEHDHHDGPPGVGDDQAIRAVKDHGRRFQLSPEAIETIGIRTEPLRPQGNAVKRWIAPRSSLVAHQDEYSVYLFDGSWITAVRVDVLSRTDRQVILRGPRLNAGDRLITVGVALVRLAQLEASGKGGKGHAH